MIEVRDLHKAFGPKRVLAGLSLKIADAETLAIIGYSGTGKSVALKHIVGLLQPDAGDVIVDGLAVSTLGRDDLTALRQGIGYVFQFRFFTPAESKLTSSMSARLALWITFPSI